MALISLLLPSQSMLTGIGCHQTFPQGKIHFSSKDEHIGSLGRGPWLNALEMQHPVNSLIYRLWGLWCPAACCLLPTRIQVMDRLQYRLQQGPLTQAIIDEVHQQLTGPPGGSFGNGGR